jgi:hypothetical protein
MDRLRSLGSWAVAAVILSAGGCSHVGSPAVDAGPDADSDTDTDSDTDWPVLAEGFDDFDSCSGCGDVYIYCSGPYGEGEVALFFETANGWALEMYENGENSWEDDIQFPSEAFGLVVQLGLDLTATACTDAVQDEPDVWRTYSATSGEASLDLTATSDEWSEWNVPATAGLYLTSVVFTPSDGGPGDPVLVEDAYIFPISVGWFPG